MNIHFSDISLLETLKRATICRVQFGSYLYGTMSENSDIDYLYIYRTSNDELNSFLNSSHQMQFKEQGIDHNFVSIHAFIRNLISGDSTVNFECLFSNEMANSKELSFLYDMRHEFISYTLIKSYLGLAKRDIKMLNSQKTESDKISAYCHAQRGGLFASELYYDKDLTMGIYKIRQSDILIEGYNKNNTEWLLDEISSLRERLEENKKYFVKYLSVESSSKVDFELSRLMRSEWWIENDTKIDLNIFYEALESPILYKSE